ncbi:hypothetical protein IM538_04145 [Cytobacillus suaedae]|nr:hypothetical protein IM538_04145 [Cytobacillus suaedae]
MRLAAVDLGIMAEHLATHEGMISKLKRYHAEVSNPILKHLLHSQIYILKSHVQAMLALIDPRYQGQVSIPRVDEVPLNLQNQTFTEQEIDTTLEVRAMSKLMAGDNFMSALMMKDKNVKHIHVQMAEQEEKFQSMYNEIIKYVNADYVPKASEQEQLETLKKYYHVLNE